MYTGSDELQGLRSDITTEGLSRRAVLKRAMALGLSAPAIAVLLAACGSDDSDAEPTATAGDAAPASTATTSSPAAEPTATAGQPTAEPTATTAAAAPTATAEAEPAATRGGGGKVNLLYWQATVILNPHLSQGSKDTNSARIALEPLADLDENTEPILVLATEWPAVDNGLLDPDGMWVTWKLREGVKWHDGADFTAEDVKFTFEWITDDGQTATSLNAYQSVESVEIVDDYTVTVHFKESNPGWYVPFVGGSGMILPEHLYKDYMGAAGRDAPYNLMPIGTGPYMVVEFKPGDTVLYEIFEDYWDPGKPYFDAVEFKGGGDAQSAARAVLQTDETDFAWNLLIEPDILNELADGSDAELVTVLGSTERIMVNFTDPNVEVDGARSELPKQHPLLQHLEVRQALALAIQRDVISEEIFGPLGGVATAYVLNYPEKYKPEGITWEYDLDQARALLAAVGFPEAFESTALLYQATVNSQRQKIQETVKQDLEALGFSVELKSVDASVFLSSDAGNPDTYGH